jgi:hypothetical protein
MMRQTIIVVILVSLLLMTGCGEKQVASNVDLSSPQDGSTVVSLTPTLTWGGPAGASYRLLVSADGNFQQNVVDAHNLAEASYTVNSGLLEAGQPYYWKVLAVSSKEGSIWSNPWMFFTPEDMPDEFGNIRVSAIVDGEPWSGNLNYICYNTVYQVIKL